MRPITRIQVASCVYQMNMVTFVDMIADTCLSDWLLPVTNEGRRELPVAIRAEEL